MNHPDLKENIAMFKSTPFVLSSVNLQGFQNKTENYDNDV